MVRLSDLAGQSVYLDTNVFIYALEGQPPWAAVAQQILTNVQSGALLGVTSELTLAECLVRPLQLGQTGNVAIYETALRTTRSLRVVAVTRSVLVAAAGIRASVGVRMPDAIHLATAAQANCSALISNDVRMVVQAVIPAHLLADVTP